MKKRLLFFTVSLLSLWQLRSQTTNGLSFDGSNDYVACGNILTTSYTKEAWVMTNGAGLQNNFVSGGSAGQHALWAPNSYGYKLSGGHNGAWNQVQDAVALTLGTWYHIALTYDAATTTMKLYKNGVLISTNTTVPVYTGGTLLQLGSYDPGGNLMNGKMDEVRIWNYARTAADISTNMNCEINYPQTGLLAYYQFNQGIAAGNNTGINTLTDLSGNNYTGTLNGFALNGATSNWILGSPVNPLPNVTASATNPVVCLGSQTTLNGGGALSYVWTGSVTDAVAFAPSANNSYTVTGTDANGCKNTAVQAVTVNGLPNVTANVTNPVVCAGDLTTLSGGGASTYTWTGSVTDAVAFAPTITDTYTVTGTDGNGCMNTAVASVTVNNLPAVTINVTNASVCLGNSTTLSGNGALTYTWTGSVTDAVAFTPTITDTYTVTGEDANGCMNTATQTVVVNNLPTVTASVSNSVICSGNTVTFNGGGASTYTWTGGVTNNVAYLPTITDTYTVTGEDANGCFNTAMQTVVVNNLPTVTASVSNSVICSGNTVTFNGGGASTYTWTGGVTNNVAYLPTITDSYTVTGTDANGCINTAIESVTVNSTPTVSAVSNASLICAGQIATLTANGANTYSWNTTSTNTAITVTPNTTTAYTVTGTSNGCSNTFVITQSVSVCTGIASNVKKSLFNIYPNPTSGLLNIESTNELSLIEVIDFTGRVIVFEQTQYSSLTLNLSGLQNAIYLIRLTNTSGNVDQSRIILQK